MVPLALRRVEVGTIHKIRPGTYARAVFHTAEVRTRGQPISFSTPLSGSGVDRTWQSNERVENPDQWGRSVLGVEANTDIGTYIFLL